ncbi:oligosaccharide flippase family protein, partial [Aerococcus urinae]
MPKNEKDLETIDQEARAKAKLNEGSAWMSISSMVSRIIGVLYIIPWMRWIGDPHTGTQANALYSIGYNYYLIFLSVAIAGVPAAISKQMTNYMARGEYGTSRRLFKSGTILMTITGLVCALLLYLAAPALSQNLPAAREEDVVLVIRSLVPALAVIPLLSILRGGFQAYLEMKQSAISQVTEQIARVAYMLVAVYVIRQLLDGSVAAAVGHSTFAAFIGAVVAIITLVFYYIRDKDQYQLPEGYVDTNTVSTKSLLFEIVRVAIPFVITGSIVEVINLIDMNTYMPMMQQVSDLPHDQ